MAPHTTRPVLLAPVLNSFIHCHLSCQSRSKGRATAVGGTQCQEQSSARGETTTYGDMLLSLRLYRTGACCIASSYAGGGRYLAGAELLLCASSSPDPAPAHMASTSSSSRVASCCSSHTTSSKVGRPCSPFFCPLQQRWIRSTTCDDAIASVGTTHRDKQTRQLAKDINKWVHASAHARAHTHTHTPGVGIATGRPELGAHPRS